MTATSRQTAPAHGRSPTARRSTRLAGARPARLRASLLLGCVLFLVYSINGREMGAGDTLPTLALPITILRGDGFALDRFNQRLWDPAQWPYFVTAKRGQMVSRYPLATGLLAVPPTAPQLLVLDRLRPGWERDPSTAKRYVAMMGKNSAALIGALVGVALFGLLRMMGLERVALPATVIAALGSDLWVVGSQSLWQHGPAALALITSIALLLPPHLSKARLCVAGLAVAALVCIRQQDAVFALAMLGWVMLRYRGDSVWFLLCPVLLGSALVGSNYWYFGTAVGGYGELAAMTPQFHAVQSMWSSDVIGGAVGTLLSPSRGLLVFSPWIALALAVLPATGSRLAHWPLICILLWALFPFLVELSLLSTWWAGWSFGPRYWTDVIPLFAIVLAVALDWSWDRSRPILVGLLASGAVSICIQLVGALCYPSSFSYRPGDINLQHERLWDWRDGELARCLKEGAHGWTW